MTDRESAEAVEAAFRAGASDYLPKLSPNELLFARVDTHVALEGRSRTPSRRAGASRRSREAQDPGRTRRRGRPRGQYPEQRGDHGTSRHIRSMARALPDPSRLMDETEGFSIRGWTAEELVRELPELLADTYNAGLQIKKIVEDLKDYARDSSGSPPEPWTFPQWRPTPRGCWPPRRPLHAPLRL